MYNTLRVLLAKLGKLDEVQRQSVISFSGMLKNIPKVENGSSTNLLFFEITKEGRKHTGISSAVC